MMHHEKKMIKNEWKIDLKDDTSEGREGKKTTRESI